MEKKDYSLEMIELPCAPCLHQNTILPIITLMNFLLSVLNCAFICMEYNSILINEYMRIHTINVIVDRKSAMAFSYMEDLYGNQLLHSRNV